MPKRSSSFQNPETGLVPVEGEITLGDVVQSLMTLLRAVQRPTWVEAASGRIRAVIEIAAAQTLATVTTVTTCATVTNVTSVNQFSGHVAKDTALSFADRSNWALNVRNRIS